MSIPVLDPGGPIGEQERDLIILAVILSAIVVIPVYFMLIFFARRYRAGNKKARYDPDFDHSRLIESVWWGIPILIITVLAVATWRGSHALDPAKPLESSVKPLKVQVVALQWKWLFIYPEHGIASVNFLQFPQKTPLNFEVTSDAPMNSFWIPKLGSQIYAMSGMSTKVHLLANGTGTYQGVSANISGGGFAGMNFTAKSVTDSEFEQWVQLVKHSRYRLDQTEYDKLAKPSKNQTPVYYATADAGLYRHVVMKYIDPAKNTELSNDHITGDGHH